MPTRTWILDVTDEAAGMVRYTTVEIQANSSEEAVQKFNSKNHGPGYFCTGIREKT